MNIKHIWSVLCNESVINQDDNNISIHGVLEQLSVSLSLRKEAGKLPKKFGIPLNYEIVSMWQRNKDSQSAKAEIAYILVDSENKKLLESTLMIEIPKTSRRFRSRMKIRGIPLTKEGDYTFRVKIKEEGSDTFYLVAELPLEVKINVQNSPASSQTKH